MNHERCEHTTFPVEVLPLDGGKKIAHYLGCGRTGPVCKSSTEAIVALRSVARNTALGLPENRRRRSLH